MLPHREVSAFRWAAEALERTLAIQTQLAEAYRGVEEGMALLGRTVGRIEEGHSSCT